jgi:hypothetical protein
MNPLIKYFNGEKAESYLFLAFGLIGLLLAIYSMVYNNDSDYWKGFVVPIVLVSFLEVLIGITIIRRSPDDIVRVENYLRNTPEKIASIEIPRMHTVMQNFVIYRYVEIAIILLGILVYFVFAKFEFWSGLGLALFIQASILFILDYFAERRGFVYIKYLNGIVNE